MIRTTLAIATVAAMTAVAVPAHAATDAEKGAALFASKCGICHPAAKDGPAMSAPNLFGVVGRKAGTADFAEYSPALKASGIVWDEKILDSWLEKPAKLVPGTKQNKEVAKKRDREVLIAYLKSLK